MPEPEPRGHVDVRVTHLGVDVHVGGGLRSLQGGIIGIEFTQPLQSLTYLIPSVVLLFPVAVARAVHPYGVGAAAAAGGAPHVLVPASKENELYLLRQIISVV